MVDETELKADFLECFYFDPKSSRCLVVFDMTLPLDQIGRRLLHTFAPLLITTTVI